jgi:ABC-type glycerol-3-phosphate transport system permease component
MVRKYQNMWLAYCNVKYTVIWVFVGYSKQRDDDNQVEYLWRILAYGTYISALPSIVVVYAFNRYQVKRNQRNGGFNVAKLPSLVVTSSKANMRFTELNYH